MLIHAHTFIWENGFTEKSFASMKTAAELGYDGYEITVCDKEIDLKELKRIQNDLGITASVSCTMNAKRSIASADESYRKAGQEFYKRCLDIAAEVGSKTFCGPLFVLGVSPSAATFADREDNLKRIKTELAVLAERAQSYGIDICIEPVNRYKSDLINTVDQAIEVIDAVGQPNLKILFDTYHSNIEEKSLTDAVLKMGLKYLGEVHLCDNDKGVPGSGHIDFDSLVKSLKQIGYDGTYAFESFVPFDKDNVWRKLASSQDELAREAIESIRAIFERNN